MKTFSNTPLYLIWKLTNILKASEAELQSCLQNMVWGRMRRRNHRRKYFSFFSFISYNEHLISTNRIPGIMLDAGEIIMNKMLVVPHQECSSLWQMDRGGR